MTRKLAPKKLVFLLVAINIFHLALWAYLGTQKSDYHFDEYITFARSNNHIKPLHDYTEGQIYPMGIIEVWNAVDSSHRFDFSIPYGNGVATGGSHPPLYPMLVHLAYSFVPGHFSNWPALLLNFIALTLTAYSVFFLAREVWADDMAALFVMAVFGTIYGVVNMAVFFRMYCLLMMWAGWLVLWHVREKKNHLLLVPLVFCGALTHYYFFVLLFFTALYYGIGLIIRKKWGDIWLYIGSLAIAAGFYLLAAHPYLLRQFTNENDRAAEAFGQLFFGGLGQALAGYFTVLGEALCRETPVLILVLLTFPAAAIWLYLKRRKISREKTAKLLFIAVPALLYLLLIARISPYILDRYIAIIFPAAAVVFWGLFYQAARLLVEKRGERVLAVALVGALLLVGYRRATILPEHCYRYNKIYREMFAEFLPENNNVGVLQIYSQHAKQHIVLHYESVKNAKYMQILPYDNLGLYADFPENGRIILLVGVGVLDAEAGEDVAERLREISGKSQAAFIGYAVSGEAYLLE
jgi:hypothetical protein